MQTAEEQERGFEARLSARYDEMKWLYGELYHNDAQAFSYFLTVLREAYRDRAPALRRRDEERGAEPKGSAGSDMLGMTMYVECFGGNLSGVREHLDYLQSCGVRWLHLMPFLESPAGRSDGGYAVSDYRRVRPELGTMEDLEGLVSDCHGRGMNVCLDLVMNHTSEDHPWAVRARAGEKEFQDRYFFFDGWDIPNRYERTIPEAFPREAPGSFTWCEEAGKVVMTTFYPYQWDLNYRNPTVFNDMTGNLLYLCDRGADAVCLDSVSYIWKTMGTSCRNLPEVHTLVRILRMAVEVVCPGTVLVGDVAMVPTEVVPYFGAADKPECQVITNTATMASTWHTVATRDVRLLKHQLGLAFALPKNGLFLNYLRSHDGIGWWLDYGYLRQFGVEEESHRRFLNDFFRGSFAGSDSWGELSGEGDEGWLCGSTASLCGIEAAIASGEPGRLESAVRLDIMLHAFLLTQSGVPVLYSGDEVAQCNDHSYCEDPQKRGDGRYLHRGRFDWKRAADREREGTPQARVFRAIAQMAGLRAGHRVFQNGADTWLLETWNDHVLGVGRYYEGEKLLALFNFNDREEIAWLDEPEPYTDLLTDSFREAKAVVLGAHDFAWLVTTF